MKNKKENCSRYRVLPGLMAALLLLAISSRPAPAVAGRRVHFLATADTQYADHGMCGGCPQNCDYLLSDWFRADTTLSTMHTKRINDSTIRGLLISGDLTQNWDVDEWIKYKNANEGGVEWLYDGLGNHDTTNPEDSSYAESVVIRDWVRNHSRDTAVFILPAVHNPNYSWDWEDVHFVQLNTFPADVDISTVNPYYESLTFLMADLPPHVATSGRPVVLIHHYGFDSFSLLQGWVTEAQLEDYWNAIKDYNVIAIFTGHNHLTAERTDSFQPFRKPAGADSRPDGRTQIPAWISGSAMGRGGVCSFDPQEKGAFMEIDIRGQQMVLERYDQYGDVQQIESGRSSVCYTLSNDIYVLNTANGGQFGTLFNAFTTLQQAVAAAEEFDPNCDDGDLKARDEGPVVHLEPTRFTGPISIDVPMQLRRIIP